MEFIKNLLDFAAQNPDKPALSNGSPNSNITYGELEKLSGRAYGYLKLHGFGREDFINILMPRGPEALSVFK